MRILWIVKDMTLRYSLLLALILIAAEALAQTGVAVPQLAEVDQFVQDAMQRYSIPGGAVAIAKNGRLVFARGYGLADVEAQQAVQPDSVFRMMSISKTLAAASIMQLQQQGRLDLDARVFDLLGLGPYNGHWGDPRLTQISVRELLQHSGGWDQDATYDPMVYPILQRAADATGSPYPPSRETLIRYMLTQPLQFAPGSRCVYSNFGYLLLGRVVEKVSGKSFERYVKEDLVKPLGIERIGVITGALDSTVPGLVHFYDYPGAPLEQSTYARQPLLVPRPYSYWFGDSAGGVATSVIDLVYLISSMSGAVTPPTLSQSSMDAMLAAPAFPLWLGPNSWYGFGVFVDDEPVGLIWSHSGLSPGGRSAFFHLPNGVLYAFAVNSNDNNDQFWNYLQARLFPYLGMKTDWPEHDLFPMYMGGPPSAPSLSSPANGAAGLSTPSLVWSAAAGADSYEVYLGTASPPPLVATTSSTSYGPRSVTPGVTYYWQIVARNAFGETASDIRSFTAGIPATGLRFVPVTPCRVADTRYPAIGFGSPSVAGGTARSFAIPRSGCGIPATARAYSLNVTAVPRGSLHYLTLWPTGQGQPLVSTLNSWSGDVVANAAIVPAGTEGAVSVFVSDTADVILDINGYFDTSSGPTSYAFYPATPCRVADTRNPVGQFGGPSIGGGQSRDVPITASACAIPSTARGYSLNFTVVPPDYLGYLSTWPTGQTQPQVSTLNSWKGKIVANAAIVPGGTNESISVFASETTDVVLDVNGYFAEPGSAGALNFYPVTPCRVADTRNTNGPFGGPIMQGGTSRSFTIPESVCGVPTTAGAYSVNVTVVPSGMLSYLTVWPTGLPQPWASTLNSLDGSVLANAAIVPAGTNGAISVVVTNDTHVILDINGYFAP